MKRKILIASGVILLLAAVAGVFYWFSDRRKLEVMLDETEHLISKPESSSPHDGVLKYAGTDKIFADQVVIICDDPKISMTLTDEELRGYLASWHRQVRSLQVKALERMFQIHGDSAELNFTVEFSCVTANGKTEYEVRPVTGRAVKKDRRWLISELHIKSAAK